MRTYLSTTTTKRKKRKEERGERKGKEKHGNLDVCRELEERTHCRRAGLGAETGQDFLIET